MEKIRFYMMVLVCALAYTVGGVALPAQAALVQYRVYVDDFVQVYIDNDLIISHDDYSASHVFSDILDLSNGWHDIQITYKNRWGSNYLWFAEIPEFTIPLESFRSLDSQGNFISGLRADYYTLEGAFVKTVWGEGPIAHGWSPEGTGIHYQGVESTPWAGIYDGWSTFEERLSGQIYVVPEPASLSLLALGGMALLRRKK